MYNDYTYSMCKLLMRAIMQNRIWWTGLFAGLFMLFLCGCASTHTNAPAPTNSPLDFSITATPASAGGTNHPPGGPGGVPSAPNLSLIQARIIAVAQDDRGTVLTVEVLNSQRQAGFADFGAAVVGKQIDVLTSNDVNATYSVDQIIRGELSYMGDERGGVYYLRNVSQP